MVIKLKIRLIWRDFINPAMHCQIVMKFSNLKLLNSVSCSYPSNVMWTLLFVIDSYVARKNVLVFTYRVAHILVLNLQEICYKIAFLLVRNRFSMQLTKLVGFLQFYKHLHMEKRFKILHVALVICDTCVHKLLYTNSYDTETVIFAVSYIVFLHIKYTPDNAKLDDNF